MRAALAGLAYFFAAFAVGFVLGAFRTIVLVPRIGETLAVMAELPVILAASWWMCKAIVRKVSVPRRTRSRLAMGAVAFGLLMAAEAALSMWGFGMSPAEFMSRHLTAHGLIGLAGQVVFALFPLVQRVLANAGGGTTMAESAHR